MNDINDCIKITKGDEQTPMTAEQLQKEIYWLKHDFGVLQGNLDKISTTLHEIEREILNAGSDPESVQSKLDAAERQRQDCYKALANDHAKVSELEQLKIEAA